MSNLASELDFSPFNLPFPSIPHPAAHLIEKMIGKASAAKTPRREVLRNFR
jgi:hypothetical protein